MFLHLKIMQDIKVTIFTPTYNRGYIIMNLYESLLNQTIYEFEWIIIDDGEDNTEELISNIKQDKFNIIYKKKNGQKGIGSSLNMALPMASGYLFMKVDDDDILREDAIEKILYYEQSISKFKNFAGVSGLRSYKNGKTIGDEWIYDSKYIDATNLERNKMHLNGDKAEAYYTNILKKYGPMPVYEGEYYTWENILWDRIAAQGYKIRWFAEKIYITEYLSDGATANAQNAYVNNFKTYTLMLQEKVGYKQTGKLIAFKCLCRYCEDARTIGKKYKDISKAFNEKKIMFFLAYILSPITQFIK